jgi:hypothetical protein
MELTYREILREVSGGLDDDLRRKAGSAFRIRKAINHVYTVIRNEYIRRGQGDEFMIEVALGAGDLNQPDMFTEMQRLKKAEVTRPVVMSIPLQEAIRVVTASTVVNALTDAVLSFQKDDIVSKDGYKFIATDDVVGLNTYNLTFTVDDLKSFRINNGLKYRKGHVVYSEGSFYRAIRDHINEFVAETIAEINIIEPTWEQLYWRFIGLDLVNPVIIPINDYFTITRNNGVYHFVSMKGNTVYVSNGIKRLRIRYVPELDFVSGNEGSADPVDPPGTFLLPDSALPDLVARVIQYIAGTSVTSDRDMDEELEKEQADARK